MIRCLFLVGGLLAAVEGLSAPWPSLTVPEGFGVNIGLLEPRPAEVDLLAASGCKWVRLELSWAATEQSPGRYDFAAYDPLVETLAKKGIRVMFVLACANPRHGPTIAVTNSSTGQVRRELAMPVEPQAISFFARWAAAAAAHFKGRGVVWEIRAAAETGGVPPQRRVDESALIISSASRAMRIGDSSASIIAPAATESSWEFIEGFCQSGAMGFIDGFSMHSFGRSNSTPESVGGDLTRLRSLLARTAQNRRSSKPVFAGWGCPTAREGVAPEVQADFAVRQQLFNLLNEIPISIWHEWRNNGPMAASDELDFSLVSRTLQPTPAFLALQRMTRELAGYHIERRVSMGDEKVFVLLMGRRDEPPKLAAWTTGEPRTISLPVEMEQGKTVKAAVCDVRGGTYVPKVRDGLLSLEISGTPQFATLDGVRLVSTPPAAPLEKPEGSRAK